MERNRKRFRRLAAALGLFCFCSSGLAACGKKDGGGDSGTGEKDDRFSWITEVQDVVDVFTAESNDYHSRRDNFNFLMTATEINFNAEITNDEVHGKTYHFSDITNTSNVMYRLLVDQSAVILDANDVVLDGENVSCGVEFSVDGTNVTGYEYGKKGSSWTSTKLPVMENDSLTSMKDAVKKYKEQAFPEISLCGPWSIISYLIAFRGEKSVHDVVTSWYDENSDMFILPDDDNKNLLLPYEIGYTSLGYADAVRNSTCTHMDTRVNSQALRYYVRNDHGGWDFKEPEILQYKNIRFKLDGKKLSSLSYDVMMAENRYNDETYGLHFDFAFDADMEVTGLDRPSKEANSGVRLDEDILDDYENETLAEYKKFYQGRNYTVGYEAYSYARFYDNSESKELVYKFDAWVTHDAVSYYIRYKQNYSDFYEEHVIFEKIDETTYMQYTHNCDLGTWRKKAYKMAEGQTVEDSMKAYAEEYWKNIELDNANVFGSSLIYSSLLKSYVGGIGAAYEVLGSGDIKLSLPVDTILNVKESGLNYIMTTHLFTYTSYYDESQYDWSGYATKLISNVGTTNIEIPADAVSEE